MTPEELELAWQAFQLIEPPVQKGIADLIQKLAKKQMTAQDYLNLAATLVPQPAQ